MRRSCYPAPLTESSRSTIASIVAALRAESGQDPTTSRRYSRNLISHSWSALVAWMERLPANPFLEVARFIIFLSTSPSTTCNDAVSVLKLYPNRGTARY
jgi:hypothetical protein